MLTLYPKIKPYKEHTLAVDPIHTLYIEEVGNKEGIPVLFVHGGPGAGTAPFHRCFFDPETYRIILFDQRGCGRSTPHASLEKNTTQDLVSDIEAIREHLGISHWVVFGGSWGSTLALVYAETYPKRVMGLILRGIFLCEKRDVRWFYQEGASFVFPDYWEEFIQPVAEAERGNLVAAYYRLLTSENDFMRSNAARAWSLWEGRCATLQPNPDLQKHFSELHFALALARIECHYFTHDSFLEEDFILKHAQKLKGIPGVIVHGRYDMVCPLENAWRLHKAWPTSELQIIRDAGHAATEPGITDALIRATQNMARRFGKKNGGA